MKKYIMLLMLLGVLIFTTAAANYVPKVLTLHYDVLQTVLIGETVTLKSNSLYTYRSTNEEVATYDKETNTLEAVGAGYAIIQKVRISTDEVVKEYTFLVSNEATKISVIGSNSLTLGDTAEYTATVYPLTANQEVDWESSDTSVLTINEDGKVATVGSGIVTITATSKDNNKVYGKTYVLVNNPINIEYKTVEEEIDSSKLEEVFEALARKVQSSVVLVTGYTVSFDGSQKSQSVGSGIIYKRIANLTDGTKSEEDNIDSSLVSNYDYFVVTNKHVIAKTTYNQKRETSTTTNYDYIGIYYGDDKEIGASIMAYDEKVDIAVITFSSTICFPVATLGSSDELEAGEFIVSVGTAEGKEYYHTISYGIISHPKRYISDDTDGDEVNDWDAEYIQHDAPINSADCGSPIINMKGEVIGMNTTKKIESSSGIKVENLSFAIPIDLVKSLIIPLEKGEVIKRPLLGVSIMDVKDMLIDKDYYRKVLIEENKEVEGYTVPEWFENEIIDHGFYVADVTSGGVASIAGIQVGDVILEFNEVEVFYSYQLRAQLGNFIIGSGQTTSIVVYRNNEYLTLYVTF